MSEDKKLMSISEKADQFYDKYKDYMDLYEKKSVIGKTRGVKSEDVYALGEQLDRVQDYIKFNEENGSRGDLGVLPQIAIDVVVAANAQSPVPLMASVQPLEEERGNIYYKKIVSATSRGNVTAGDTLTNATQGRVKYEQGFSGEAVSGEDTGAVGDGTATSFSFAVKYPPVVKRTVTVSLESGVSKLVDDGTGNLIGVGGQGTINYETGAVTVAFNAAPAAGDKVLATYSSNFEVMDEIPTILTGFESMSVRAKTYALRTEIGLEAA